MPRRSSMAHTANPYETSGRLTKALQIAKTLHRAGIRAVDARRMTEGEWLEVAKAARQKPASAETVQIALHQLGEMEVFDVELVTA